MSAVFDVAPEHLAARARLELLFDSGTFRPIRTAVGDGVLSGSGRVQGRAVVAKLVAGGTAARGVIIDGAGIGSCMAANKVPGIRAALCYDRASAAPAASTIMRMR